MRAPLLKNIFSVFPLGDDELASTEFDAGYYSIGYEERSRFIAGTLSNRCKKHHAIDLEAPEILSYFENLARAAKENHEHIERSKLSLQIGNLSVPQGNGETRLYVDISSMDRRTLAVVFYHLLSTHYSNRTHVYVLYAPAKFGPPPKEMAPVQFSGPVNDLLGGSPRDPKLPIFMFIGLGYELGFALSMVETFEPAMVFAYAPRGNDKRFDRCVDRVNLPLFLDRGYINRIPYSVNASANTLIDLKERILAVRDQCRVVFVPSGPKLFSAMGILCGYIFSPDICVWRVSSQIDLTNAQRVPDGSITGFRLQIDDAQSRNDSDGPVDEVAA